MKSIKYKIVYNLTKATLYLTCGYLFSLACVQLFVWLRDWSTYLINCF